MRRRNEHGTAGRTPSSERAGLDESPLVIDGAGLAGRHPRRGGARRPAASSPVVAAGLALVCLVTGVLAGTRAELSAAPRERAALQENAETPAVANPIESTPESRAIGRQRYVFMCRECHGNRGRGDGDMAHAGGVPSDFTDDVWDHGESDGEIFAVIKEGVSADMQGYANRLSDEEIWHVVNYLRSLSR
ncbi:MAG: c-type cytochrome [Acidobacteria bacterium]|nr:c-type cytochrome [Acidobacteriota bacterium]